MNSQQTLENTCIKCNKPPSNGIHVDEHPLKSKLLESSDLSEDEKLDYKAEGFEQSATNLLECLS